MEAPHYRSGRLVGSLLAGLLGGAFLLAAISMAASIADRSEVPVEGISSRTVAVAVAAAFLVCVGVLLFAWSKRRDVVLLSALATVLLLVSVAGLFSIGIFVLPFAIGAVYLLFRRASGLTGLGRSLFAGPAIAVGLATLLVIWVQEPLVECTAAGAETSSRPWWSERGSSGQGSSSEDASAGLVHTPAGRFVFRCTDGELTQFRRIGR